MDEAVLVDDDVVGEDAVDAARKRGAIRIEGWYVAVEPALENGGRDAVTDLDARDAGADLHDLAGCVRDGRNGNCTPRGATPCSTIATSR